MNNKQFTLTKDHIKLLSAMADNYLELDGNYETVPQFDSYRPYGNSFYVGDIAEILGIELPDESEQPEEFKKEIERLSAIQKELIPALKFLLSEANKHPELFIK